MNSPDLPSSADRRFALREFPPLVPLPAQYAPAPEASPSCPRCFREPGWLVFSLKSAAAARTFRPNKCPMAAVLSRLAGGDREKRCCEKYPVRRGSSRLARIGNSPQKCREGFRRDSIMTQLRGMKCLRAGKREIRQNSQRRIMRDKKSITREMVWELRPAPRI